jgi:hypothetical protein
MNFSTIKGIRALCAIQATQNIANNTNSIVNATTIYLLMFHCMFRPLYSHPQVLLFIPFHYSMAKRVYTLVLQFNIKTCKSQHLRMTLLGSKRSVEHKLINYSCVHGGICIISYAHGIEAAP